MIGTLLHTSVLGNRESGQEARQVSDRYGTESNHASEPGLRYRVRWRHVWTLRLVLVALLLASVTYVAVANFVLIDLRLIGWRGDVRLSWVVLGAAALGFVTGILINRVGRWLM